MYSKFCPLFKKKFNPIKYKFEVVFKKNVPLTQFLLVKHNLTIGKWIKVNLIK